MLLTTTYRTMVQLLLLIFIIKLLFQTIIFADSLNISFHRFDAEDETIIYERDAYAVNRTIQLTRKQVDESTEVSIGRATYYQPMHLWDKATRRLTDFTTHFSFHINSDKRTNYSDGFAFFLAPNGTVIPANATLGGGFGLTNDSLLLNRSANQFVAVEFDIFQNVWDPGNCIEHVGIDINSINSSAYKKWSVGNTIEDGLRNEGWIIYDATSRSLTVVFTNYDDGKSNMTIKQSVSYIIDLRDYLPEWVSFGFSGATEKYTAAYSIYTWELISNMGDQGNPSRKSRNMRSSMVVGLVVGACVLIFCGCGLALFGFWKKRIKEKHQNGLEFDDHGEFDRGAGPRKFRYNVLARATNNFANKLGEGGFGGVYRGFLRDMNCHVAVKRISKKSSHGIKAYESEVKVISRLRHRNLVQLVGWCHEKEELLLVYEYMPNSSLDAHLFTVKSLLTWSVRYKIAQALASALRYLHEDWEQCVLHRDIKSSNILLDLDFNPKVGDFGLARLVDHEKGVQTTDRAGTRGYMAPEYIQTGKASRESDIFSFGVVALEIACGRPALDHSAEESRLKLVDWVWDLYGIGKLLEAADQKLSGNFCEQEMRCLMMVGLWCAHPNSTCRPSLSQAIEVLNFQAELPVLPQEMPVAMYSNVPLASTSLAHSSGDGTNTDSSSSVFVASQPYAALLHTI